MIKRNAAEKKNHKNQKIGTFRDFKEMVWEEMWCSVKDQKMSKLSSQMLQRQRKKSRRKVQLGGEDMGAMALLLKKKKINIQLE